MSEMNMNAKLVYSDNGKHKDNSVAVSMRAAIKEHLYYIESPSDIIGTGKCYEDAFCEFKDSLKCYIKELQQFYSEITDGSNSIMAIEVNLYGNPVNNKRDE